MAHQSKQLPNDTRIGSRDMSHFIFIHSHTNNFFIYRFQVGVALITLAQNVYYLYVSRLLVGLVGGAMFVLMPLMVGEIAEDR